LIFSAYSDIRNMVIMHPRPNIMIVFICSTLAMCMGFKTSPAIQETSIHDGQNPVPYLCEKAREGRLILLGTRHDNKSMHNLIAGALPQLVKDAGVNTLFLEIPSKEQANINRFLAGKAEIADICMWKIVSCNDYCKIILKARELGMKVVAMDNDEDPCITRDRWMAVHVADYLGANPGTRGMVVVGNCHVLKNIRWANEEGLSLADYLNGYNTFSILMWAGAIDCDCPHAVNVDPKTFRGVKDPTLQSMNLHPQTSLANTADGVIFLP